ncbi:hypothetical protein SAM23877_5703 [Streptomyces ambofaciens ATCC 23877]|uniref:Uncharacterized protein n=1 Tax=Streptomyces ambofaciens (strain ATCC 23877 / 3486 / DSM 40053 / JCM 4204 / NBRC 12836 / NRRL B-2516) TaxID=278992 RepID=A0A0K2B0K4_STRA7|nr:hypothetical protein SAM23877_5703 [Streptomyces ambofaciens ATCC 23877]
MTGSDLYRAGKCMAQASPIPRIPLSYPK